MNASPHRSSIISPTKSDPALKQIQTTSHKHIHKHKHNINNKRSDDEETNSKSMDKNETQSYTKDENDELEAEDEDSPPQSSHKTKTLSLLMFSCIKNAVSSSIIILSRIPAFSKSWSWTWSCHPPKSIILRQIAKHFLSLKRSILASYISLILCMMADLYPSTPRCNTALAVFCLILQVSKQQRCQTRNYYKLLGLLLAFSILLDLDWIFSNYYPASLRLHYRYGGDNNNFSDYDADDLDLSFPNNLWVPWYISFCAIIANLCFKVLIIFIFGKKTKSGRKLKRHAWKQVHNFCPPMSKRWPKHLKQAIEQRIFSVVWIELICAIILFVLFGIVHTTLSWAPHFSTIVPPFVMSLNMMMLLKGCTSLIFVLTLLSHADIPEFLAEYGCIFPKTWYYNRKQILREKRGGLEAPPKVKVTHKYIVVNGVVKLMDLAMGVLVWMALYWANQLGGRSKPKEIRIVLALLTLIQFITDILVVLLCATIYWYVVIFRQTEQLNRDQENINDLDDKWLKRDYELSSSSESDSESYKSRRSHDSISSMERHQIDYDFSNNVPNSQNVFERRMLNAKMSPAKTLIRLHHQNLVTASSCELDLSVACEPEEFSHLWDSLPVGLEFQCITEKLPLMREFHKHLEYHRIFIIASGVVGEGIMKLFLIAQLEGSRCLMEWEFDPSNSELTILFKANKEANIPFFLQCLQLNLLFGNVTEKKHEDSPVIIMDETGVEANKKLLKTSE